MVVRLITLIKDIFGTFGHTINQTSPGIYSVSCFCSNVDQSISNTDSGPLHVTLSVQLLSAQCDSSYRQLIKAFIFTSLWWLFCKRKKKSPLVYRKRYLLCFQFVLDKTEELSCLQEQNTGKKGGK